VDGLLKEVEADGRVRSVFKQTETRTGRISSTEPNMQNIPVRMISYGGSNYNISFLIREQDKKRALQNLSAKLFS
jgi:DNA polymerase I-like protein with 3'-5' exonuclease and polymerase domains